MLTQITLSRAMRMVVRDFAFASSRKFIWDAQAVPLETHTVMAMSFYPKEGLPVWAESLQVLGTMVDFNDYEASIGNTTETQNQEAK